MWFYYLDDVVDNGWQPFDHQVNLQLEDFYQEWRKNLGGALFRKHAKKPVVASGPTGFIYEICFETMTQKNILSRRVRPIERTVDRRAPTGIPLTQEERAFAKRKGFCGQCGIRTISITWFRRTPIWNENVYKGTCIKCNPTLVPAKVLQEWEYMNPRATIPPIPSNTDKTGPAGATATVDSQKDTAARQLIDNGEGEKDQSASIKIISKERHSEDDDSEREEEQSASTEFASEGKPSQDDDGKGEEDQSAPSNKIDNEKISLLKACFRDGFALMDAPDRLKSDKEVALLACAKFGLALQHVSDTLRADEGIVLVACSQNGVALKYASEELQDNKQVVLTACSTSGIALQFASPKLQKDKGVVLIACSQDGLALKFAAEALRADKEVAMTAAESNPQSLKFALGGLNQDKDCLIKASLWDDDYEERRTTKASADPSMRKIVLSTKFSLAAESSHHATRFTVELKKNPYIARGFVVYSPNAFNKSTCDPNWTDKKWPCRGTYESCQMASDLKTGVPQESLCCWRYSFRYHLHQATDLGGMMIQVVDLDRDKLLKPSTKKGDLYEKHAMGNGQSIETEMARAVGIKVFRFFQPLGPPSLYADKVDQLVSQIQKWYEEGCNDMTESNLLP